MCSVLIHPRDLSGELNLKSASKPVLKCYLTVVYSRKNSAKHILYKRRTESTKEDSKSSPHIFPHLYIGSSLMNANLPSTTFIRCQTQLIPCEKAKHFPSSLPVRPNPSVLPQCMLPTFIQQHPNEHETSLLI